ncbi:MAG TPA: YwiC-like family protein [Anaeromyxobacteraceae bacterium]|nr:YwiC-like family protein [Anaeromyxobacteraceae bacterium]
MDPASPPGRSLLPREHGAWGQLAMPLLAALAIGSPSPAALLLAAAVVLAFVAHEPLLVLLGQRGRRAREQDGARARRWLLRLGLAAAATGAGALALAPHEARAAVLLPAVLGALVGLLVWRGLETTTAGEIAVASALSSAGFAVARVGGASFPAAASALATWVLAFAAAILAVQVVLVRSRSRGERDPGRPNAILAAAIGLAAFGLVAAGLPAVVGWATAPPVVLSIAVCLGRFSARRLRQLGWAIVASTVVTLVILVAGLA